MPTTTVNAPLARGSHTAVWTGREMIVWGGEQNDVLNTGGSYCAQSGPTSTPTPSPSASPTATAIATATTSPMPTPGETPTPTASASPSSIPAHPLNLSTRLRVLTDANAGIGGFIITGTQPKQVILRGIGPSLAAGGVPNPFAD